MREFQLTHNRLRDDFLQLHMLAEDKRQDSAASAPLIRSCCRELFAYIEADLYLINQWNPYDGFDDRSPFLTKFKKTYRHHAESFKKHDIRLSYQAAAYRRMLIVKEKRDAFTHPKNQGSLLTSSEDLDRIFVVYREYTDYINELMTNVGVLFQYPI